MVLQKEMSAAFQVLRFASNRLTNEKLGPADEAVYRKSPKPPAGGHAGQKQSVQTPSPNEGAAGRDNKAAHVRGRRLRQCDHKRTVVEPAIVPLSIATVADLTELARVIIEIGTGPDHCPELTCWCRWPPSGASAGHVNRARRVGRRTAKGGQRSGGEPPRRLSDRCHDYVRHGENRHGGQEGVDKS